MKTPYLLLVFAIVVACQPKKESVPTESLNSTIEQSLEQAVMQYMAMDKTVPDTLMPRSTNSDGSLMTNGTGWWTSGFFPGSLWYLYEYSKNDTLLALAKKRTAELAGEQWNTNDHDIGFKMNCSYGNGLRILNDTSYIPVLLNSAKSLTKRFKPEVGLIRSWGDTNSEKDYLVIVDNMMNLELLYWATRQSGDSTFFNIAVSHADSTMKNHYRENGSSWHVVDYDPNTGEVVTKKTAQGYADNSSWARGQSWGLYGYVMSYRETGSDRYLAHAVKIADFLVNHPNLPDDKIPYWDYDDPDIPNTLRDASAGAIMASALLELSAYVEGEKKDQYLNTAETIIRTLSSDEYRSNPGENNHFLLKHSVGHKPANSEVDVPLSYADYYYIEAMMRWKKMQ